ncbi:MAG: hypothetical protein MJE68_07000, partial [Proteobacteria bacterium]|nr:hypothetical protein [Pseudomonadota bacterium]
MDIPFGCLSRQMYAWLPFILVVENGFSYVYTRDGKLPFLRLTASKHVCDDVRSLDVESLSE